MLVLSRSALTIGISKTCQIYIDKRLSHIHDDSSVRCPMPMPGEMHNFRLTGAVTPLLLQTVAHFLLSNIHALLNGIWLTPRGGLLPALALYKRAWNCAWLTACKHGGINGQGPAAGQPPCCCCTSVAPAAEVVARQQQQENCNRPKPGGGGGTAPWRRRRRPSGGTALAFKRAACVA